MKTLTIPHKLILALITCSLTLHLNAEDDATPAPQESTPTEFSSSPITFNQLIELELPVTLPANAWANSKKLNNTDARKLNDRVNKTNDFVALFEDGDIIGLIKDPATENNPIIGTCDKEQLKEDGAEVEVEHTDAKAKGKPNLCKFKYAVVDGEGLKSKKDENNETLIPFQSLASSEDECNAFTPNSIFYKTVAWDVDKSKCLPVGVEACVLEYETEITAPPTQDGDTADTALNTIGIMNQSTMFDITHGQHGACDGGGGMIMLAGAGTSAAIGLLIYLMNTSSGADKPCTIVCDGTYLVGCGEPGTNNCP